MRHKNLDNFLTTAIFIIENLSRFYSIFFIFTIEKMAENRYSLDFIEKYKILL